MDLGFLNGLFGSNTGAGFQGKTTVPGLPQAQTLVNPNQLNQAYGNTQGGIGMQQNFLNALGYQGIGNQQNFLNQQQGLANQLGQQAQGMGPNPAAAQLALTTGQNIQQQGALMGSARGGTANPGLIAREAAQQGGNLQQQAVGQAAVLRAQQQLAAQQALMQQQANMQNVAGLQVGQTQGALNAYNQAAQGQQGQLFNAANAQNQQNVGLQENANTANAGIAQQNAQFQAGFFNKLFGGATQGGSAALQGNSMADVGSAGLAGMAQGGVVQPSMLTRFVSEGGKVSGKAKVSGDSLKNDTVNAKLSPGEIVIPRSHSKDPQKMVSFLNGLLGTHLRAQ